jgi:hypothetical protein
MMRGLVALALLVALGGPTRAQEGEFLTEAQAPAAVFPTGDAFDRRDIPVTPELRARVAERLGGETSMWEERWVLFRARLGGTVLGDAVIVEEIGKHRPITFVVGVRPDGTVADVAVMSYREAYGGEVRTTRFLGQYRGKRPSDPLRTYDDIRNIAGATLSVDAASRAVHKAQAVAEVMRGATP